MLILKSTWSAGSNLGNLKNANVLYWVLRNMLEAPGRFPANILGMGALSAELTREGESRQVISTLTNEAAVANQPPFIP